MKKHAFTGILAVSLGVVTLIGCNKEAKTYTIKFTNGNELVQTQHVQEGKPITAPDNPKDYEKDGTVYTFDAWYDVDNNKLVSGTTTATKDVEYSAKFNVAVKSVTVTFVDHEGTETEVKGKYGEPIVAPEDPAPYDDEDDKYVHVFEGWYDGRTKFEEGMKFTKDRTFVANYERGRALEYEVTFLDTDKTTVVDTKKITVIKTSLVTPKLGKDPIDPNRTYKWECKELSDKLYAQEQRITFTKAEVNEYTFIPVEADRDFTVQFLSKSGEVVDVQTFTQTVPTIVGPKFVDTPDKYYEGIWKCDALKINVKEGQERRIPNPGNYTFVFDQTPIEYIVAEFDYGEDKIEEKVVTIENPKFTAPEIEDTALYNSYWVSDNREIWLSSGEEVTVDPSDFETTVHFTLEKEAINYTWSFVKDGYTVAEVVINRDMTEAYAPHFDEPTKHYDGNWINEETRLSLGSDTLIALEWLGDEYFQDLTLEYRETPHMYEVYFEHPDGKQETLEVNIEDQIKTTPSISLSPDPGKTYKWVNEENKVTLDPNTPVNFFEDITCLEDELLFKAVQVGNTHTVTLNGNGGSVLGSKEVTVSYGEKFVLPSATPKSGFNGYKFVGWYDANDNLVCDDSCEGTWMIDSDVTLFAKWQIDLSGDTVPSIITSTNNNVILSMAEDPLTPSNGKVLKAHYNEGKGGDEGLNVNEDYIKDMLGQDNVVGIAFDAAYAFTSDDANHLRTHCNFRSHFRLYRTDQAKDVDANSAYENSADGWGLSADAWKTFTFKKEYYAKRNEMTTAFRFIICGGVDKSQGNYNSFDLYVRNIRPITELINKYDFENGGIVTSSGNYSYRTAGHNDNRFEDFETPVEVLTGSNAGVGLTYMRLDNSQKTSGNTSLKTNKTDGSYVAFFLPGLYNTLGENGYVDVDIRSTKAVNSTTTVKNFIDGSNNCLYPVGQESRKGTYAHPANEWVTYRFKKKDNMINDSNRFLIIQGSSGGDWWFDNIRVNPTGE